MRLRRLACFLLGGWLLGSILALLTADSNFETADALLRIRAPETAKLLSKLEGEEQRMLMFFMAEEASRASTAIWQIMQIWLGIGTVVTLFLERHTRFYSAWAGLMLLLVLFEWLAVTPQLNWLGRSIDFVPWKLYSNTRDQYWNLRGVYLGVEAVKLLAGALIVAALLHGRKRRSQNEEREHERNESGAKREQSIRAQARKGL